MVKTSYDSSLPYVAVDGTLVRELMHPQLHGGVTASLSEVVIGPLEAMPAHRHPDSDKVCHVTEGKAALRLGDRVVHIKARDTFFVPKNTTLAVNNSDDCFFRMLCFFTPPLNHNQTVLE